MSSSAISLYRQCVRTVPAYMADETARSFFKLSLLKEMTVRHQATAVKDDDGGSDGKFWISIRYTAPIALASAL